MIYFSGGASYFYKKDIEFVYVLCKISIIITLYRV